MYVGKLVWVLTERKNDDFPILADATAPNKLGVAWSALDLSVYSEFEDEDKDLIKSMLMDIRDHVAKLLAEMG